MVVFNDKLFSDDVRKCLCWHYRFLRIRGCRWLPRLLIRMFDRQDELFSQDERTDEVSGLSLPICGLLIHRGTSDMGLSHGDTRWFCLLSSAAAGSVKDGSLTIGLDGQGLDHWRGVVWDPGIVGQQCLHVCYDCLCWMTLFCAVMLLVHVWAEWSFWTEIESGYCRTITWELGYLGSIYLPCDVDRLCGRDD